MRIVRLLGVGLVLVAAACDSKKADQGVTKASADMAAKAENLKKEEADLVARRDALQRERKKASADRNALAEKRKAVLAAGGDVAAIDQEEAELASRETALSQEQSELDKKVDTLILQYQEYSAGTGEDMARREAALALREKDLARREEKLSEREGELAGRERAQAQREKETCGVPTTTTIVQTVDAPRGSKYNKRDVEPVLKKARSKMSEKGILASDLPAPAQGLEREANEAMEDGDYGKAKLAADQLLATVESVKIDKAFIAAKIGRLNAAIRGKQLDDAKRKEVEELFRAATADYGDGKFTAANAKLNKIWAIIR